MKLQKQLIEGSSLIKTIDYLGAFQYENNTLQFISQPEGYIYKDTTGYRYVYQYKDHLGNNRLSFMENEGSAAIVDESNYYPFGLTHKGYNDIGNSLGSSAAKKYKFNGKELQDEIVTHLGVMNSINLDMYDYGARHYDPSLGRWFVVDPLAEKMRRHSPYNYAFDNPIYFVDPDGMTPSPGDPIEDPKIRDNRASNLFGKVRTKYNKISGEYEPNSKNHQGFDFEAEPGTDVMSVKDGTVVRVQTKDEGSLGKLIAIEYTNEDGETRVATYAHLSEVNFEKGNSVCEGDVVGQTGVTGNADESSPHLHFELRTKTYAGKGLKNRVNPNEVLTTKFVSQDGSATQTTTGVVKVTEDGTRIRQNRDGTEHLINAPFYVTPIGPQPQ